MDKNIKWYVLAAILLYVGGYCTSGLIGDRKLQSLQHYADSVTHVARTRDSVATKVSDQLRDTVAVLTARKTRVVVVARVDSATVAKLDTALTVAQTLADSNAVLTEQNTVLKRENLNLWQALAISDTALTVANLRGDTLLTALNSQTAQIVALNTRIQQLTPRTPKWLKISFEVIKIGGAFYAGTQAAKN